MPARSRVAFRGSLSQRNRISAREWPKSQVSVEIIALACAKDTLQRYNEVCSEYLTRLYRVCFLSRDDKTLQARCVQCKQHGERD